MTQSQKKRKKRRKALKKKGAGRRHLQRHLATGIITASFTGNLLVGALSPAMAQTPQFTEQTGVANPFNLVDVGYFSTPTFVDIDGDGDLDAFIGEWYGNVNFFENTGDPQNPVFTERTGAANPFNGVDIGYFSTPAFVDIDNDGDFDAFIGVKGGSIHYFENTGTAASPTFVERIGAADPFDGVDVGSAVAPAFVDIDGDGDFDAFIGEYDGNVIFFENTGTAASPAFVERTGTDNPLDMVSMEYVSSPTFVDIDGDGDLDAFVGEAYYYYYGYDSYVHYFENIGDASTPAFVERTGAANPLNMVSNEYFVIPTFADIDGDGDFDAFIGEYNGTIHFYRNDQEHPPTADAGPDQAVDEGITVTLNGSGSSDPDDGIASYLWTQESGTTVTLSDATAVQPTFVAPEVDASGAELVFKLTVTDQGDLEDSDQVSVTVHDVVPAAVPDDITLTLPPGTTVADYRIVSIPLKHENQDATVVIGGQIGPYDQSLMRIATYGAENQVFMEYPFTGGAIQTEPGFAAWFIFRHGKTLTFEGTETPVSQGPMEQTGYSLDIKSGWNLIGNPFNYEISVESIIVQEGTTEVYLTHGDNQITQPVFWIWSNGVYVPAPTLPAGTGGWLLKLTPGDGRVFFPAVSGSRSSSRKPMAVPRDLERPPAPPSFLSQPSSEGGGGGCFISTLTNE